MDYSVIFVSLGVPVLIIYLFLKEYVFGNKSMQQEDLIILYVELVRLQKKNNAIRAYFPKQE